MSLAISPAGSSSKSFVTSDRVHLDHLRTCLELSLKCEVSPTAFCVGSILVLPSPPGKECSGPGLVLSTGYSREPPRPTSHAESSAVFKLLALSEDELCQLLNKQEGERWEGSETWSVEDLLKKADCYTTLEPCSVRTSGQPDCARLLAKYQVNRVFLGVEEPPDFVDCAGSRLLSEAGVEVYRVGGLERECLEYARRGRND
ncbi:Cytosine deaminase FCY1 and related enzymes [Phaffia rhodozyma]|uniref:Cytosine deaminase FCY1 and related enzymes n=1 Tax=Phaffia rhodozyma TaxID=264483 RepID=A0A0F7SVW4_PHARH|nr:Cytosine deaminase FCY1 and related enzymes [Phaffia rhodozyma]